MKGIVKFYSTEKGFGFIKVMDESGNLVEGEDIFFHITGVTTTPVVNDEGEEYDKPTFFPRENDLVQFEVEDTEKGPKAVQIEWLKDEQRDMEGEEGDY